MNYQKVKQQEHRDLANDNDDDEISIMSVEQQVYLESLGVLSDIDDHEALMRETLDTPLDSPYANNNRATPINAKITMMMSADRNYTGLSPAIFGSSPPLAHQQQQKHYQSPARNTKYKRSTSTNNTTVSPLLSPIRMMEDSCSDDNNNDNNNDNDNDFDGFYRNNPKTVAQLHNNTDNNAMRYTDFDSPEFKAYQCVRYLRLHKRRVWFTFGLVVLGCCLPVVVRIASFQPKVIDAADASSFFRKRSINTKKRLVESSHYAAKQSILTTGSSSINQSKERLKLQQQPLLLKANQTAVSNQMLLASNNATAARSATPKSTKPGLQTP